MINGINGFLKLRLSWLRIGMISAANIHHPGKAYRAFRFLDILRRQYSGNFSIIKGFNANGRSFWYNHVPGFPSVAYNRFHREELNLIEPFKTEKRQLRSIILSITNACPLNCKHCYEAPALNTPDKLNLDELKRLVISLQKEGITQIYFTGGEPMTRFKDVLEILSSSLPGTDFWMVTSGIGMTREKVELLRKKGLTGICVSIDHFEESKHNAFRRNPYSFQIAVDAVRFGRTAGLAMGMAICVTRDFISKANLFSYLDLAHSLGAHFIQIQEPFTLGNYLGKDVLIHPEQSSILDSFYEEINFNRQHRHLPLVVYHAYHQRRTGCRGGGNRYLYISADGSIHACPYCRSTTMNVKDMSVHELHHSIKSLSCSTYTKSLN